MIATFFSGLVFGLLAAVALWLLRSAVNLPKPRKKRSRPAPEAPSIAGLVFTCPRCGKTGGRTGPFLSAKALFGHARVCKRSNTDSTGA